MTKKGFKKRSIKRSVEILCFFNCKSPVYHISDNAAEIAVALNERALALNYDSNLIPYFSTDFRFFLFSDQLYQFFSTNQWRYYYSGGTENFGDPNFLSLFNVTKKSEYFSDEAFNIIDLVLNNYKIQLVVLDQKQVDLVYEHFERYCQINKENEEFVLYECKY